MNVTIVLFQTDVDQFSVLAVDLDQSERIWKGLFASRVELLQSLGQAGAATAKELLELDNRAIFYRGAPVLRACLEKEALEDVGFERVLPHKPN